jgi:hypothetical protein
MSRIPPRKSDGPHIIRDPRSFELANVMDDPFAVFSEWTLATDEKAYAGLKARSRKIEKYVQQERNR